MNPLLSLRNLSVNYGTVRALTDVSLDIGEGELVALVGPNGSGKSSLLKAIVGLVTYTGGVTLRTGRDGLSYLPQVEQAPHSFPATAREIVLTGTQRAGHRVPFYTAGDRRAADDALELMGVAGLCRNRISDLSGGQRQRVLLARALCGGPSLLLLDEPCAALDPEAVAALYALLGTLSARGIAIVMATHDIAGALAHATRVIGLDRSVMFDGPAASWPGQKGGRA